MDGGRGTVIPLVKETLEMEVSFLRESLQKSQATTERMVTILGSFDRRLSALDSAMRPTQMRTHVIGEACGNIDKALKSADGILRKFYILHEAEAIIQKGPHEDMKTYLMAMNQLRSNLHFFDSMKTTRNGNRVTSNVNSLLVEAVLKLEEEFKRLLSAYSLPVEPNSLIEILPNTSALLAEASANQDDYNATSLTEKSVEVADKIVYKIPVLIQARTLPLLHDLALQMVQTGTHQECVQAYRSSHAPVLERTLRNLGVDRKEDVQRLSVQALGTKIESWIHAMQFAIKSLFPGEKLVCHQIFQGIDSLEDKCFVAALENSVEMLLSFGYTVAKREWPPEMLFPLLQMYKAMHELQSEVETILAAEACENMRKWVLNLTKQLAKTARTTINDFEKNIIKEDSNINASDATVHSMTSYVFNYVKLLGSEFRSTLGMLFEEHGAGNQSARVMEKIFSALVSNLEAKSQKYNEPALGHLFLANNINYMVCKVRSSSVKDQVGSDWVPRHRKILQQNATQYKRVAWMPILQILTVQGGNTEGGGIGGMGSSSGASRSVVKEKFKLFNSQFEEIIQQQSHWTVPDTELRESLRLSVAEVLLPAYRNFTKRYGPLVEGTRNQERFWKYTPEDVERRINNLFQAGNTSQPRP